MSNITDYIGWRGDLAMEVSPWNEVDALLFATLSYLDFHGTDNVRGWTLAETKRLELLLRDTPASSEPRCGMYAAMADSRRFGDIRMHHAISVTDAETVIQFAAVCYDLPDGSLLIAFRGTDSTVVGWREDLNMSLFEAVPAQEAAEMYLRRAAEMDGRPLRIVGHSKGGNLAAYAAAGMDEAVQDRILEVYSFDGPGMSPDVFASEGYRRIAPKIRSFVPETSIIGMLMEYHREYRVVRSSASGMMQHDPLTWQVFGPHFEEVGEIDRTALTARDTLHEWLDRSDPEQRAAFVDTVFQMIEGTKANTVGELMSEKLKNLWSALGTTREISPETRKTASKLVGLFLSLGAGNMVERYRSRWAEEKGAKKKIGPEDAEKADEPEKDGDEGTPGEGKGIDN